MIGPGALTTRPVTGLTRRQAEVYGLITAHHRLWGVGPTPKVLAGRLGVVPQTIEDLAVRLYSKGYLASPRAPYTPAAPAPPAGGGS